MRFDDEYIEKCHEKPHVREKSSNQIYRLVAVCEIEQELIYLGPIKSGEKKGEEALILAKFNEFEMYCMFCQLWLPMDAIYQPMFPNLLICKTSQRNMEGAIKS